MRVMLMHVVRLVTTSASGQLFQNVPVDDIVDQDADGWESRREERSLGSEGRVVPVTSVESSRRVRT
jgi:hypothetical protein